jgi:TolA-binding protein
VVAPVVTPSATESSGVVEPTAIAPPAIAEDAELDEMYTKARSFFNDKKYKESFLAFKEVYEKDSKGAYAEKSLYWMANSYDQTGQSENAITVLDRLLLEFPGGVKTCQTLFQKGRLFGDLKKVEEQKQVWQTLIDDPGCAGSNEAFRAGDLIGKLSK